LRELQAAGVRVALGTDSRASNPDLSVLAEIRHVALAHPEVAPENILRMATLDGAEALGLERNCGSISPGKLANLLAIPLPAGTGNSLTKLLEALLFSDQVPTHLWVRGQSIAIGNRL
jgi:cytosine/adenosine deaminase-related metal-dependent hydrolase